jgi:trehalose 6-phosphate synthase/phosphatase
MDPKNGRMTRGSGGLVSALLAVNLDEPFAWLGFETNPRNAKLLSSQASQVNANLECHPVLLSKEIYDLYYDGFSNDMIWPLFHYEGHLATFVRKNWLAYVEANQAMADAIAKIAQEGDTVWIHDFHFLMLPKFLREKGLKIKIGFFLHIPFPSSEVFRQLPVREEILSGMIQCDLIGFHEHSYLRQFIVSLKAILGIDSSLFEAEVGDHTLHLGVYPISIDTEEYKKKATSHAVLAQTQAYRYMSRVPFQILGVDRLDYTKGLELKLRGFQQALRKYPELVGHINLLQVAVPTRQKVPYYMKIRKVIEQLVGSINGEFGGPDYVPVQYIFNSVDETQLLALYRRANAALVTSKRDGMNLVAMEYIIAQDIETPGSLILSEFAGAASFLSDALIINPWDVDSIADAIHQAYKMPFAERRERLSNLQEILSRYSATKWAEGFLRDLEASQGARQKATTVYLTADRTHWPAQVLERLKKAPKVRLVVDYDGTLVSIERKPERALLQTKTRLLLEQLQQHLEVFILSGRSREFLDQQFPNSPFFLGAEHGAFYRAPGAPWESRVTSDIQTWYPQVEKVMQSYAERVPLSFVEKKEASLVWHFRESPKDFADFQSRKMDDELQIGMANEPVSVVMGLRILEAKSIECNKGNFLRRILQASPEDGFYLCLGDDRTDEDMFRVIENQGISIKIGPEATQAQFRLSSQSDVDPFLTELLELMQEAKAETEPRSKAELSLG